MGRGCQCEGRSCFGRACVGICSMSTCEVQKMNPISQESPTYVKYIVPLYQFIYQATECQLDSQDGAGIWRVVGANALPQLSSSGWLHLELSPSPMRGLPGRSNLPESAGGLPAATPCTETRELPFRLGPPDEDVRERGPSHVPNVSTAWRSDEMRGSDDEAARCTPSAGYVPAETS